MSADLTRVDHRPWPLPSRPWVLSMRWRDLAFLHWPVRPDLLRDYVPAGLEIDTFDNSAWLGVVPFAMEAVCPRYTPRIPPISDFPEINLRTYVRRQDKPGVFFFSLDAASWMGVRLARTLFQLPYFDARMSCERGAEYITYDSLRVHRNAPPARFRGRYRPVGPVAQSTPGSIEHWLTERYCLYTAGRNGALFRGEIHHGPWPLQRAECELEYNEMGQQIGISLDTQPPQVHFASELAVRAWLLQREQP